MILLLSWEYPGLYPASRRWSPFRGSCVVRGLDKGILTYRPLRCLGILSKQRVCLRPRLAWRALAPARGLAQVALTVQRGYSLDSRGGGSSASQIIVEVSLGRPPPRQFPAGAFRGAYLAQ